MNQPTIEQFNELRRKYFELATKMERFDEMENQRDFTIRDSSVKIGIAEGLAKANHAALSKFELKLFEVEASVKEVKEISNRQFKDINDKLDRQETIVKENSEVLGQHVKRLDTIERTLESHGDMLRQHGDMLRQHGDMLRQILAKLS